MQLITEREEQLMVDRFHYSRHDNRPAWRHAPSAEIVGVWRDVK